MSVKLHEVQVKTCSFCGETKPLSGFNKVARYNDGLDYNCRPCANQLRTERRKGIHRPRIISTKEGHRICTICKIEKPFEDFPKSKNKLFGVHCHCKICINEKRRGDDAYRMNAKRAYHKRRMDALLTLRDPIECFHCFMPDLRLLSIDHIHNNGNEERKEMRRAEIYRKIIKMGCEEALREYQILCRNCNWLKHIENMGDYNVG